VLDNYQTILKKGTEVGLKQPENQDVEGLEYGKYKRK
jgi:hypothetical protein